MIIVLTVLVAHTGEGDFILDRWSVGPIKKLNSVLTGKWPLLQIGYPEGINLSSVFFYKAISVY